jgi:hypothetical protein
MGLCGGSTASGLGRSTLGSEGCYARISILI